VTTVIHTINRDPRNFEDANAFRPERFIDKATGELIRNKKFMPFQAGRCHCWIHLGVTARFISKAAKAASFMQLFERHTKNTNVCQKRSEFGQQSNTLNE
jgi:hypothetical protein